MYPKSQDGCDYDNYYAELRETFKQLINQRYEIITDDAIAAMFTKAYDRAYDRGHSAGYDEVVCCLQSETYALFDYLAIIYKDVVKFPQYVVYIDPNEHTTSNPIPSKAEYESMFDAGKMSDNYEDFCVKEEAKRSAKTNFTIQRAIVKNSNELATLLSKYKVI
jgi:hypothetical protein